MSQLKFIRLQLLMIVNHAQLKPAGEGLEKIKTISGTQTVRDTESLVYSQTDGSFVFWYVPHGHALPLADTLLVKRADGGVDSKPNTRAPNEIEPRNQLFGFYDMTTGYFYLSDSRKQSFVLDLFNSVTTDLHITWDFRKVYKSAKEFLETIHSVKSIVLTSEKDLFNKNDYEFPLLGKLANPNRFELRVNFDRNSMGSSCLTALEGLVESVRNGRYKSLVCVGDADDDIERVFNSETFVERVTISVDKKEENGMYDPASIKRAFIDQVIRMEDA